MADNEALAPDVAIESTALLEALLAAAPVGLGFRDRDLRFVRANAAWLRYTASPARSAWAKRMQTSGQASRAISWTV